VPADPGRGANMEAVRATQWRWRWPKGSVAGWAVNWAGGDRIDRPWRAECRQARRARFTSRVAGAAMAARRLCFAFGARAAVPGSDPHVGEPSFNCACAWRDTSALIPPSRAAQVMCGFSCLGERPARPFRAHPLRF